MRLVTARPVLLLSPEDFQWMDRRRTDNNEAGESSMAAFRTSGWTKKAFTTSHCAARFAFNTCQKVSGTLCDNAAASGRMR